MASQRKSLPLSIWWVSGREELSHTESGVLVLQGGRREAKGSEEVEVVTLASPGWRGGNYPKMPSERGIQYRQWAWEEEEEEEKKEEEEEGVLSWRRKKMTFWVEGMREKWENCQGDWYAIWPQPESIQATGDFVRKMESREAGQVWNKSKGSGLYPEEWGTLRGWGLTVKTEQQASQGLPSIIYPANLDALEEKSRYKHLIWQNEKKARLGRARPFCSHKVGGFCIRVGQTSPCHCLIHLSFSLLFSSLVLLLREKLKSFPHMYSCLK